MDTKSDMNRIRLLQPLLQTKRPRFSFPNHPHAETVARTLSRCPFLAQLPGPDLAAIAALTVIKTFQPGQYLFHEGGVVQGFYFVKRGAIKVHRVNWTGKEQVLHIYRPVESFAEETLLSELGHATDACAIEPSEVLMVRRAGFTELLRQKPELALCLLRSMNRHLCLLIELLDDLTLKDVKTRLAQWLLQRCPDPHSAEPCSFQLVTTKRILAAELGAASETFSRAMAKFRAQKLLSTDGRTVTLLCPTKLARLAMAGQPALRPAVAA
jgi:CRP/FNR family transcriptional regulator, dissimilatory nitrate respiration regulator